MSRSSNPKSPSGLNWWGWLSILAFVLLAHFTFSVALWLIWWGGTLMNPSQRLRIMEELSREFMFFLPALCLMMLSAVAWGMALKRRTALASRLLLITTISSVLFFLTDVFFHRYQILVCIATKEYWDDGGSAHHYFTWWWYNDRWFS